MSKDQGSVPATGHSPRTPAGATPASRRTKRACGCPHQQPHPQARPTASPFVTISVPLVLAERAAALADPRDGWEDKFLEATRTGLAVLAAR